MNKPKRRFGDRYDGYRIRDIDPIYQIVPSIMRTRLDSQVFFDHEIDITELEKFVREHRKTDMPDLRMLHIFMAALVRVMSQMPQLNRFIAGKKLYAHKNMIISLACKRSLSLDSEETTIKPEFEPEDTLYDVVAKVERAIREEVYEKQVEGNDTDVFARALGLVPTFIKAGFVDLMRNLDKIGLMPKFINHVSPFHSSMFITDLGSCGIGPIFHHLYEFGTCSAFVAIGKKETKYEVDAQGNVVTKRYMGMKIVADERVCDGFYYATAMRQLARLLKHPERLLTPPEEVVQDNIRRPTKKERQAMREASAAKKGVLVTKE